MIFGRLLCELLEIFSAVFPLMLGDLERERPFFATAARRTTLQQLRVEEGEGVADRLGMPDSLARLSSI